MKTDVQDLKNKLTIDHSIQLLEYYGFELRNETDEYYVFSSVCHQSNSSKVHLYKSTNTIFCFVCGNIDLISIVQEQEELAFQDAIDFIVNLFQLNKKSFGRPERLEYKRKEIQQKEIDIKEKLPTYNNSILNTFVDYQPYEWAKEDISIDTMKQFEIKFNIESNAIIIPIRDGENNLVGIRCRNLDEDKIERFGKYGVYTDALSGISYKCLTGRLLYGLNKNKEKIMECKKIIIVEGEKSVLKSKSWFGCNDITVASYGCNLTNYQIEIIKSLGVKDIIFMYDREEDDKINKKMEKVYRKCALFFDVYYIKDYGDLIDYKDSPLDKGEKIYKKILNNIEKYKLEVD